MRLSLKYIVIASILALAPGFVSFMRQVVLDDSAYTFSLLTLTPLAGEPVRLVVEGATKGSLGDNLTINASACRTSVFKERLGCPNGWSVSALNKTERPIIGSTEIKGSTRIGAKMKSGSPYLKVIAFGPKVQSLTNRDATANWAWAVTPKMPGRYTMSVEAYAFSSESTKVADFDSLLSIHVEIIAKTATFSSRLSLWFDTSIAKATALAGVIATLAGIGIFSSRRKSAEHEGNTQSSA